MTRGDDEGDGVRFPNDDFLHAVDQGPCLVFGDTGSGRSSRSFIASAGPREHLVVG